MFAERLICSWIGAFGLAAGAFCQTYVQFSIDAGPIPGSINQKGEIAGTYVDFANGFHGFVRDPGGKITAFDAPGSFGSTRAISINAGGAITGTFIDTTPPVVRTRAYVRDPEGNFTTFDPPGSVSTVPHKASMPGAQSPAITMNRISGSSDSCVIPMERSLRSTRRAASHRRRSASTQRAPSQGTTRTGTERMAFCASLRGRSYPSTCRRARGHSQPASMTRERLRVVISTPGHFPDPSLVLSVLCAIHMGNSRRSTLVLVTQSRRLSTTKERLRAFWKTLPWTFFTVLCGRPRERVLYSTRRFAFPDRP